MYDIRVVLPGCYPIEHSDLESSESFGVIIVAIYFFTVKESVDVEKIEIEPEDVGPLFYHCELKPPVAKIGVSFMHNIPFMFVKKFCTVHRHHEFGHMSCFIEIERESSGNIS